jgi:hypothetical protein
MRKTLIRSALALAVALTSMPLGVGFASAQDIELRIDEEGPRLRLRDDCDPRYDDCDGYRRGDRDRYDRDRYERRGCSPERALRKAERMGIRRARIVDVGRRTIDVRGRDRRGDRVMITFGRRDRDCPVLRG